MSWQVSHIHTDSLVIFFFQPCNVTAELVKDRDETETSHFVHFRSPMSGNPLTDHVFVLLRINVQPVRSSF